MSVGVVDIIGVGDSDSVGLCQCRCWCLQTVGLSGSRRAVLVSLVNDRRSKMSVWMVGLSVMVSAGVVDGTSAGSVDSLLVGKQKCCLVEGNAVLLVGATYNNNIIYNS